MDFDLLINFLSEEHFEVDNKRYDVVSIDRPDSAYIILDLLSKDKNLTRGVHLVKMEGKNNIRLVNN